MKISTQLDANMQYFSQVLRPDINFDVVYRVITVGGRNACLYFIDGFTKDDTLLRLMQAFVSVKPEAMPQTAHEFSKLYLPYGEVGMETDSDTVNWKSRIPARPRRRGWCCRRHFRTMYSITA